MHRGCKVGAFVDPRGSVAPGNGKLQMTVPFLWSQSCAGTAPDRRPSPGARTLQRHSKQPSIKAVWDPAAGRSACSAAHRLGFLCLSSHVEHRPCFGRGKHSPANSEVSMIRIRSLPRGATPPAWEARPSVVASRKGPFAWGTWTVKKSGAPQREPRCGRGGR